MKSLLPWMMMVSSVVNAQKDKIKTDTTQVKVLQDIVISASKQEENLLQSPVSIEKLSTDDIKQSAQPSFFDAIENLKGVYLLCQHEMVDGMDNQAPHIGAPIANSLGPNDLDIYRVEVIPGSSSAMYGMNAINGAANLITKSPVVFQGLSIQQKTGINHVNDSETGSAKPYSETSFRFAEAFNEKFACKLNGTYLRGTDWYAD
ncbi:MAG: TonB-dependent receptor plug domain-containing protein, partial [Cytophagales bacterium]|nr:TonB-dependent receptor plug domain-containing protein [Cytophagales bacterium]